MLQTFLSTTAAATDLAKGFAAVLPLRRRTLADEGISTHYYTTAVGDRRRYYSAIVRGVRVETWTMDRRAVIRGGDRNGAYTIETGRPGESELALLRRFIRDDENSED
jgi:hypothetical protein